MNKAEVTADIYNIADELFTEFNRRLWTYAEENELSQDMCQHVDRFYLQLLTMPEISVS